MKFALITHDNKESDMVAFISKHLPFFNREDVDIVTTYTTGKKVKHAGIEKIETIQYSHLGGNEEISSMIIRGEITAVMFLRDPLDFLDGLMLMRLCDLYNVPLATNYKTANILVKWYK